MATSKDKKTTGDTKSTASSSTKKTTAGHTTKSSSKSAVDFTETEMPSATQLKERFKTGSIPLQTDFADLIDVANVGRLAVGDNGTGWGLVKDSSNRLQYDPNTILDLSYNLSPCSVQNEQYVLTVSIPEDVTIHKQLAFLALHDNIGPVSAVNSLNGNSTTFRLSAIKIDSTGTRTPTTVDIIADKSIGKNSQRLPLEYVTEGTSAYSIWYSFMLDTSTDDFTNCTLSINPLILACYYIPDTGDVSVSQIRALLKVNFVYNSSREIIPRGLISMFSGNGAPAGWALCDGNNGTPNLTDRFVMGGSFENVDGVSTSKFSGDKNNKSFSISSEMATINISGTTQGHALTAEENGPHSHLQGETLNKSGMCHNGYSTDTSDRDWVNGGSSGSEPPNYRPRTYSDGQGKEHSHAISLTSGNHQHTINLSPPYYILAFIMKL